MPCKKSGCYTHTCIFAIDHAEVGREEPPEPAQVEGVNTEQDPVHGTTTLEFMLSFIF
jgi:hypothetical protein